MLFAGIFWWSLGMAVRRPMVGLPSWEQAWQFAIALVFFCIMLALFGIAAMASHRRHYWVTALTGFASSVVLILFFPFRWATFFAFTLSVAAFLVWGWSIAGDVESRRKFQPHYTIHAGFSAGLLLFLLSISMCYYSSLGSTAQTADTLRTNVVTAAQKGVDLYLPKQVPGYRGDMSLDQFLSLVVTDKFGQIIVPEITSTLQSNSQKQAAFKQITDQLQKVSPVFNNPQISNSVSQQLSDQLDAQQGALQQEALKQLSVAQRQLLDEARKEFLAGFRIDASGTDTMDTVVSKIMTRNVTKYVDPYEQLIPPVLALSFFFIIELFSVVFRYAIFFLAPLIAWVYRKLGLLHITEKTATVQDLDV